MLKTISSTTAFQNFVARAAEHTPLDGSEFLKVVAISDTHGFEKDLKVPEGDVLLHCGDFATDGRVAKGMARFECWLDQQPHPFKIVVRGNHDPMKWTFGARDVLYATDAQTIDVAGVTFSLAPYPRKGGHKMENFTRGDLVASHVPPYGIVDRMYAGKNIGDLVLKSVVSRWSNPPSAWFCGHVHEAYGDILMALEGRNKRNSKKMLPNTNPTSQPQPILKPKPTTAALSSPDSAVSTQAEAVVKDESRLDVPAGKRLASKRQACKDTDQSGVKTEVQKADTSEQT